MKNCSKRRVFYISLVRSIFEHCSQVWNPCNSTVIVKMEKLQMRAVKWILNEQFSHYSVNEYNQKLKELNLIPLNMKLKYTDLLLFFKIINNLVPINIPSYLNIAAPIQRNNTRQSNKAFIANDTLLFECNLRPVPTLKAFTNNYFYRTHRQWNSVPLSIRQCTNFQTFKIELKNFLWLSLNEGIDWTVLKV